MAGRNDKLMNILEIKNVSKNFLRIDSEITTEALRDISFTVRDGEFVSIVGPSGCGKSTILRMVAGLINPTKGEILLNGEKIEGTDKDRGMVFQKATLFPWLTVRENVAFSLADKKNSEVDRLIQKVSLEEFSDSYVSQLSGGMAQRVSLIRTMINHPKVFLLDEPLGALDAFTRMNMQDEILNLYHEDNNIIMMVTHDVDEAVYMSDKVIIMDSRPGRIKEIVDIDIAHPRNRKSKEFTDYRNYILGELNI